MPPAARLIHAPPAPGPGAAAPLHASPGAGDCPPCCPYYHEAVELIGKRWTGAILRVLLNRGMRFSEIAQAVPELSDRLLSERMKELEARGVVSRLVDPGPPIRVEYTLSSMGRDLEPALAEIEEWAQRWLAPRSRRRP
ncbi:MAG: helix-turn-helix transcriptional regulator [Solirubrobacterales bacterium]|nr:helix-turn-helix transcriptional regulator [Solirubrobacterales bacterium]